MRSMVLCVVALAATTTAFVPQVHHLSERGATTASTTRQQRTVTVEWMPQVIRNRVDRIASFNSADAAATASTPVSQRRRAFGWQWSPPAGGINGVARSPQRVKADLSKLFATPEPAHAVPGSNLPLVGTVSRTYAHGVQSSCGSSPIFFAMCALCARFAPAVAMQVVVAWGVGKVAYWFSMRGADVSQRLPAGLVGYMALFLLVGGLSFLNGLKAVALLA